MFEFYSVNKYLFCFYYFNIYHFFFVFMKQKYSAERKKMYLQTLNFLTKMGLLRGMSGPLANKYMKN